MREDIVVLPSLLDIEHVLLFNDNDKSTLNDARTFNGILRKVRLLCCLDGFSILN